MPTSPLFVIGASYDPSENEKNLQISILLPQGRENDSGSGMNPDTGISSPQTRRWLCDDQDLCTVGSS